MGMSGALAGPSSHFDKSGVFDLSDMDVCEVYCISLYSHKLWWSMYHHYFTYIDVYFFRLVIMLNTFLAGCITDLFNCMDTKSLTMFTSITVCTFV